VREKNAAGLQCSVTPVVQALRTNVVHASAASQIIVWCWALGVVSFFANIPSPHHDTAQVRRVTINGGALRRPSTKNARSTRRERRDQQTIRFTTS